VTGTFNVGLTRDGFRESGESIFGELGLQRLDEAGIAWNLLPAMTNPVDPATMAGLDAILSFGHLHFDLAIVEQLPRLKLIARFGAGYDGIDLAGLARAGVVVTNTPTAVRRPQALATLTMVMALSHQLLANHRTAQSGAWEMGRGMHRGLGIQGRTLGIVGFGGVGSELADLARPLGFSVVAHDRPAVQDRAQEHGVALIPLLELAAASDYVVVAAALNESTHHMIDQKFFDAMKPSAFLVNTSRGELVDPQALRSALASKRIAGAGLDVYDPEPPAADEPILGMDSVILSPHCLCWTADFTRDVSASVIESIVDVAEGRHPDHTLNPSVYETGWRRTANRDSAE
jgi:phosphoglycerate dehydrogenase-like enzyme